MFNFFNNINFFFAEFSFLNYFFDIFLLQFAILYTIYLLFTAVNIYYVIAYLFLQIAYFGLILSVLQLDLFTGFLWVTELTILFVFLILCFYLNAEGSFSYLNKKTATFVYFFIFCLVFLFVFWSNTESNYLFIYNYVDLWDDFYESVDNSLMTDFHGLFCIYYYFNSFYTITIFFILFVCSVVCVVLNKNSKLNKKQKVGTYLSIFNYFKDFSNFFFYRKQNLSKQTMRIPATKIFKKKFNK